ncbi:uncharacterized protein LOC135834902 [Planococcus citri]|uniref:uncharacterized protein LOC135834902 n=1 Tax=Planococcus citri TaxID=170843 RepID=UPI0031F9C52D
MYLLCLNIRISTVTCPGVWLCPKGEVILKVQALQQVKKTKGVYPKFPIPFVEKLSFQKVVVGGVESIADLLDTEEVQIELIQWIRFDSKMGVVLAKFSQHLGNLFDSFVIGPEGVSVSCKTDMLMRRTEYFPGIISPKVNATFELEIESHKKNMDTLYRSISPDDYSEPYLSRQRRVCHSYTGYPYCSICSLYKYDTHHSSYPKYESRKSLSSIGNYSGSIMNLSCCSWCDYSDSSIRKCCCCCKYHHLLY